MKYVKHNEIVAHKVGEMYLGTNLPHNMFTCVDYFFYYYHKPEQYRFLGQYLINLSSFYELFIKYKMTTIHKSLIWKDISKFNEEAYSTANFNSIDANIALSYAKNLGWVNNAEYEIIYEMFKIRNKFIHFSLCAEDESGNIKIAYFEHDFEQKNYDLVKKLLLDNKELFKDNFDYQRICKDYSI